MNLCSGILLTKNKIIDDFEAVASHSQVQIEITYDSKNIKF